MSGSKRPDLIFKFILIKSDLLPHCSLRGKLNVFYSEETPSSSSVRLQLMHFAEGDFGKNCLEFNLGFSVILICSMLVTHYVIVNV